MFNDILSLQNFKCVSVGFTGSSMGISIYQECELERVLKFLYRGDLIQMFNHGDCIGADAKASFLAKQIGYKVITYPPENNKKRAFIDYSDFVHKEKPYLERNRNIVNDSNFMIACPDKPMNHIRSGTNSTIRYSFKSKKPIIVINSNGATNVFW